MSKKVVRVEKNDDASSTSAGPEWTPSAGAKAGAGRFRLIAVALWALAIGSEIGLIFGVLRAHNGEPFTNGRVALLVGGLVVIAILAIAGNLLWKKANRLDPAHKSDTVRFFVQNQLGAFITLLAFVPLIVLILLDKDLSKGQKAVAGGIGIALALLATTFGIDVNPPSVEQYTAEQAAVEAATGQDLVYWTKAGEVFHVCEQVSDLQHESKDNTIYSGTVAEAHAAGKDRMTLKIDSELKQCGLTRVAPAPEPSTAG